jgi:hypothetical protein
MPCQVGRYACIPNMQPISFCPGSLKGHKHHTCSSDCRDGACVSSPQSSSPAKLCCGKGPSCELMKYAVLQQGTGKSRQHACLLKQAAVLRWHCPERASQPQHIPAVRKVCGHMPQEHPQVCTLLRLDLRLWLLLLLRALFRSLVSDRRRRLHPLLLLRLVCRRPGAVIRQRLRDGAGVWCWLCSL